MSAAVDSIPTDASAWRPLPPRAKSLFALSHGATALVPAIPLSVLLMVFDVATPWWIVAVVVVLAAIGARVGVRRHRTAGWRLDDDGFAFRRGRWWYTETRVPASRVQHLDLRHGPLERRWKLATLVIHTAGSKMSAVSVSGLDENDAEALRDRLARQIESDDAL
jgi:membrane protein YdbS with pleckstrin-like domain